MKEYMRYVEIYNMMHYVCWTDHSMEQIFLLIKVKWKYFASTFTENCKYHDIVQCNSLSLILLGSFDCVYSGAPGVNGRI